MIRQLSDGTLEFDSVEEAVWFVDLREEKTTEQLRSSTAVDNPSRAQMGMPLSNEQLQQLADMGQRPEYKQGNVRKLSAKRLKPTQQAEVTDPAFLLEKSCFRDKDVHNFIYQHMLSALQVDSENAWFTNKDLVLAAANGSPVPVTSIDISYGLVYLLTQGLIEEHPDDLYVTRGNRYRVREEVLK